MPNNMPTSVPGLKLGYPKKVAYTALALVFILIGVAGLLIPIIPGVLFLVGAILLLSQVSGRVRRWSDQQAWMSQVRIRLIQLGSLRPLGKVRFVLLLTAQSVVSGLKGVADRFARLKPRVRG